MRKLSILLSLMVLAALALTACGGEENSTTVASPPPVTVDATDQMVGTATDSPTDVATEAPAGTATGDAGVPVTGDVNPARLSNQMDFTVWSQDGEQIGEVDDMLLDLDNTRIAYVVVGTGGFLDLGERNILVPWDSLQLQTGSGDNTGGQQNAFILQGDVELFRNAPDFDLSNLPQAGQTAGDWDVDIRNFWQSGGATGGTANTPEAGATTDPNETAVPNATAGGAQQGQATATLEASAGMATATLGTDQGTGIGTGTEGQGQALQGVVLASDVLGATITLSPGQGQGQGQGAGQGQATVDPNATMDPNATATTDAGAGTGTGQGVGNMQGMIDDMIVAADTGELQYLVVDATLDQGERWIPVPLSSIQWDATNGAFVINANPATFSEAPFFENGQYPDTMTSGWNSEYDTFWQNSGSGTP